MLRALVLIAAVLFFRAFLPRRPSQSPTAISPYMNSLDGLLSQQQISSVMDDLRPHESAVATAALSKQPPATRA